MTFARLACALTLPLAVTVAITAAPLTVTVATPPPADTGYFKLGTNKNPSGQEISVNSRSLLFGGQPVFPVMGEFHYSRCPAAEWREELVKMKAGGVDIVATYVFWIHHEEIEGQWDWSGQRDLRRFVQTCGDLGLKVVVRAGPWCHGEVRNGGLPDWVVAHKDWKLRSTDTNFFAAVKPLYAQIGQQLAGELWKDGGPVIGIQVDNEFGGAPEYLLALKRLAIASGIDVPLYIKTGWPAMRRPVPLGELLPLFGAYPDGFWDNSIQPMPSGSWANYTFKIIRTDTGIGNDTLKTSVAEDTAGTEQYPHLTCEVGGGMPASYHRRMNYDPRDVEAVVLTQLGGGSSLLGYYMYHGGQNPEGKLSTLQESRATHYPNDLPVKSYDFNAPIGEFGQLNPQYYWLRRLHLFLHDFGGPLAQMPPTLPDRLVEDKTDLTTLRWAVRSDGTSGYVFVNNYQRLQPMPIKSDVQFQLHLPGGDLVFPHAPVTIPADQFFFWPFNLNLSGAKLIYATAQPVCQITNDQALTVYFAEIPGVNPEFVFDPKTLAAGAAEPSVFSGVKPGRDTAITVKSHSGQEVRVVLLSEADSLALRKTPDGRGVIYEPAPTSTTQPLSLTALHPAGPARAFAPDGGKPIAPTDDEFTNAAIWRITLPAGIDLREHPLLRIHYVGDVARLTLNGRLIEDNFYSGRTFDLGLKRYAPEILTGDLQLQILPLRRDAPIYLTEEARGAVGSAASLAAVQSAEIVGQP